MIRREVIPTLYFEWMVDLVCGHRYSKQVSYDRLLTYLHHTAFRYTIQKDENRYEDGIALRYRFHLYHNYPESAVDYLENPCSILEMMVALAIRCEENIMDDPRVGDRTGQWFWGMIVSLGLGAMTDDRYDEDCVTDVIETFLDRDYSPDGRGGLFTIKDCKYDLRNVEIWYQLCWYLDTIA